MPDENSLTLRQLDQPRGDPYAIQDGLDFLKMQFGRMPTRRHIARVALFADIVTASLVIL
jgi:hypothetical protein